MEIINWIEMANETEKQEELKNKPTVKQLIFLAKRIPPDLLARVTRAQARELIAMYCRRNLK